MINVHKSESIWLIQECKLLDVGYLPVKSLVDWAH